MNKPRKPATTTDLIDELRKQSHFLTNSLPPIKKADAAYHLGCDATEFGNLLEEALATDESRAQIVKIISVHCVINNMPPEVAAQFFHVSDRLADLEPEIRKLMKKVRVVRKGRPNYTVINVDANTGKAHETWELMNPRARRLSPELLIPAELPSGREEGIKVPRTIRFDTAMDAVASVSAAAANVGFTEFVETLIKHYSDSLVRGYIERFEKGSDEHKNATHLYDILRKRYGNKATFVGAPPPPQTDSSLGPDGPKYDPLPEAKTLKKPSFSGLINRVTGLLQDEVNAVSASNDRQSKLMKLQLNMITMPKEDQTKEQLEQNWLTYLSLSKQHKQADDAQQEAGERIPAAAAS